MSEDVTLQPTGDTNASENNHPQTSDAASLSNEVPSKSPEEMKDTPAGSPGETSTNDAVPANVSEVTSTSDDTAAKTAEITSSSESTPIKAPVRTTKAEPLWLNIVKRVLVGIVLVLTLVGLLIDMTQLVGVWVAYGPARNSVITVSNTLQQGLQTADKGLTRADGYVTQARQVVTQVNDVVTLIGDNLQNYSPIITALTQRINTRFGPALEQAQTTASNVHDAALKVNGALEVLNRFPGASVPTFSDQLAAISARAQEAQSSMQDLRTTLAQTKTGVVTHLATRITTITARTDTALAKIQSLIHTYQAKVINAQNRLTARTNQILTLLLVSAISVTILCLIVAAALLLLFLFCLQFVIHGHFPSLRVVVNKGG